LSKIHQTPTVQLKISRWNNFKCK